MHPALEKLLQDIEQVPVTVEQRVNYILIWFPMPPSNFLKGLSYGEAKSAFNECIMAYYNAQWVTDDYHLPASAGREAQYAKLNEVGDTSSVDYYLQLYYGNSDIAFELAKNEVEGGIHVILKTFSDNMIKNFIEINIKGLVDKGWGSDNFNGTWREGPGEYGTPQVIHKTPLYGTFQERQEHVQSYKNRYTAFLPGEYLEEDNMISVSRFSEILLNHHKLIQGMNSLIR